MTIACRYPHGDTRSRQFRRLMIEDAIAMSSSAEAVAMVREAFRKGFDPDTANAALKSLREIND